MHSSHLRTHESCEPSELAKTPTEEVSSEPETEPPLSESGFFSDSDGESDIAPEHDGAGAGERWSLVNKRLHLLFADADTDDKLTARAVIAENWRQVGQRLHRLVVEAVLEAEQAGECSRVFEDVDLDDADISVISSAVSAENWRQVGQRLHRVFSGAVSKADEAEKHSRVFAYVDLVEDNEFSVIGKAARAENWRLVGQRLHHVFAAAVSEAEGAECCPELSQIQRWRHVGELIGTAFADAGVDADADW